MPSSPVLSPAVGPPVGPRAERPPADPGPGRLSRLVILTGLDVRAFRGGEKYAATLGRELVARGVEVRLFSKIDPNEHFRLDARQLAETIRLPIDFYPLLWLPLVPPIPRAPRRFLGVLRASDTVFTLDGTPRSVALVVFVSRLLGRRVVVGLHSPTQVDTFVAELEGWGPRRWRALLFRAVLRRAHAVHTINVDQAAKLRRVGLFRNVAMVNSFTTALPLARTAARSGSFESLFVGPLEREQKGIDLLVDIGRRVLDRSASTRLTVVGAGRDVELVEQLVAEFPGRVRHLGFVEEAQLSAIYASADLLWLTSRAESFSLVALEAFTQGVPVISFGIPGLADVTSVYPEGRIPPFDPEAFSACVLRLRELQATRPDDFERLRERCRTEALARFGAAVQVPKLAEMLGVSVRGSRAEP